MADYTKNIVRWLDGLTKDQFDEFIKIFIKIYWRVDTVSLTDGKGDGGIDVKIFKNKLNKKIPLQITVDSNVYQKLEKDLIKIQKLIIDHDYSENFFFYYSKGASEAKAIDLIDKARNDFSINLEIFDNKLIASYLEKKEYGEARDKLREILGGFLTEERTYFDESDKLYFDFINYASDSKELKERFIYSFVLNELFNTDENTLKKDEIIERVEREFCIKIADHYYEKMVNSLSQKSKIEIINSFTVRLTSEELENLEDIKSNSDLLEREFLTKLQEIVSTYDTAIELKELIEKLYNIFKKSSEVDFKEINDNYDYESAESNEIQVFYTYVSKYFLNTDERKRFIFQIFTLCADNDFIYKVSAGKLFKDLLDSSEFGSYFRRQNKEVFLDTPVLIYLLLVMKEPDFEYDNYKYKISKNLYNLIQSGDSTAVYNTTEHYVTELADYLNNSIRLIPLYDSGLLESLGGSQNELLNFYLKVKESGLFEGSFESYLEDFGIDLSKSLDDNYLNQYLLRLLKDNNVNIDEIHKYDTDYKTRNQYQSIAKTLGEIYSRSEITRKPRSLKFDSLLFMHLYDTDINLVDPTVLTWDNSFREFRKEYQSKNPNLRYWHLFRPGKYLDHVSLLKFKINGAAISNEILSIIETEFEVVKGVRKLSDILASIVDLKSASGTRLTRGLADIRNVYIYGINSETDEKEIDSSVQQPVDEIISHVVLYYSKSEGEYSINDFAKMLLNDEAINMVLELLRTESDYLTKYNKYSDKLKSNFDNLIRRFKVVS